MVAHRYNLTTSGSLNIIFSNVLWGYFVRAIPIIKEVLSYSVATMGGGYIWRSFTSFPGKDSDAVARSQISEFSSDPVIVWGLILPYEAAYPIFNIADFSMKYQIHGFGVFSPAPVSVAFRES